jgi:hypothetical protein
LTIVDSVHSADVPYEELAGVELEEVLQHISIWKT